MEKSTEVKNRRKNKNKRYKKRSREEIRRDIQRTTREERLRKGKETRKKVKVHC